MSEYDNDERISFLSKEERAIFFSCNIFEGINDNWSPICRKIRGGCPQNYQDVESFCIRTVRSYPEAIIGYTAYDKLKDKTTFAGTIDHYYETIGLIISKTYCEDNNIQIPTTE